MALLTRIKVRIEAVVVFPSCLPSFFRRFVIIRTELRTQVDENNQRTPSYCIAIFIKTNSVDQFRLLILIQKTFKKFESFQFLSGVRVLNYSNLRQVCTYFLKLFYYICVIWFNFCFILFIIILVFLSCNYYYYFF